MPHILAAALGCATGLAWPVSCAAQEPKLANVPDGGRFRVLAPGVEVTIPPDRQEEETFSTHDVVEILRGIPGLEWKPNLSPQTQTLRQMATNTVFRREIWCLEFTFKPVRMIWVDVPQRNGAVERKLIWYMIYHVRNTGGHLKPTRQADGTYVVQPSVRDVAFFPIFRLRSHEFQNEYLDRIIPVAIRAIQQKEDPNRTLLSSVDVSRKRIALSTELVDHSVWGVATWEDIDPRVDYFSVYIEGLSNAYKWVDPPEGFKQGDPPTTGRVLLEKNLVLNFWRPGDQFVEDQRVIRYGIPGQVDYRWEYR
jgi:hypothetical protein